MDKTTSVRIYNVHAKHNKVELKKKQKTTFSIGHKQQTTTAVPSVMPINQINKNQILIFIKVIFENYKS